jgi:NADH:ubiquinone oxidoreductase subunit F (NADH-binding)
MEKDKKRRRYGTVTNAYAISGLAIHLCTGSGAMEPLQSALKYFSDDFEKHIKEKRCPYNAHHLC